MERTEEQAIREDRVGEPVVAVSQLERHPLEEGFVGDEDVDGEPDQAREDPQGAHRDVGVPARASVRHSIDEARHDRGSTTPVEQVIGLLEKLQAQIQEEGKAEAAAYDKFACFCKEQADNKQYAIEKFIEQENVLKVRSLRTPWSLHGRVGKLSGEDRGQVREEGAA